MTRHIDGGIGQDHLTGSARGDVISGRDSGDVLSGGGGDDVIYGFGPEDLDPSSGSIGAEQVATGLDAPLYAISAPGETGLLFVPEQHTGKIQIVDLASKTVMSAPFLDIPDNEVSQGREQGLLGMAFSPDYATSGKVYVSVTNGAGTANEIWEYTRSATDPLALDPSSRRLIMSTPQPYGNHNGGWIGFGPDGDLYVARGDGGGPGGDVDNDAQNLDSLLGKILRIDVTHDDFPGDPQRNYAIPPDNPFVGKPGADEVWDYGLRNPWRPSFDAATGDLYIGDVGQKRFEEIDWTARADDGGLNFGWRRFEGFRPFQPPDAPLDPTLTYPVIAYPHGDGPYAGEVVTGGYVYHGPGGGQGIYVFGDFTDGQVWTTRVVDGQATDFLNRDQDLVPDTGQISLISSFGVDDLQRLYLVSLAGSIYRLNFSPAAGDGDDLLQGGAGADRLYGGTGEDVLQGGPGDDLLNGGLDPDRASYQGAAAGVVVDLTITGPQDTVGAGTDTLVSIEGLIGSSHADSLAGDEDDNVLQGGAGDDQLFGDGGADRLEGGKGADLLTGGGGADTFVYSRLGDSMGANRDLILDLADADVIDLSGIDADSSKSGDQAFHLAPAFSRTPGELVLTYDAGAGRTILKGDVDGDGRADIIVEISGDHSAFSNFVL